MHVSLQPDVQKFVEEKVRSGEYATAEDAVNALLSLARQQERLTPEDIEELKAEVDLGIVEAERGDFVEFTAQDIIAERRAARKKVS